MAEQTGIQWSQGLVIVLVAGIVAWLVTVSAQPQPVRAQVDSSGIASWRLVRDGAFLANLDSCGGFGSRSDIVLTSQANGTTRKSPGATTLGNVTCERANSSNTALYGWRQELLDLGVRRSTVLARGYNAGGTEIVRWELSDAWPLEYVMAADREIITIVSERHRRIR